MNATTVRQQLSQPSQPSQPSQQQPTRPTAPKAAPRLPLSRVRTPSARPALPAIERTLQALLAPLDFESWKSWQVEVHSRLLELTGADALCIHTPLASGPEAWHSPHLSEEALCRYAANAVANPAWDVIESGFAKHSGRTGEAVAHESELMSRDALEATPFFRDFLRPNRIFDLIVAGTTFGGPEAARLHFSFTERQSIERTEEVRTLVRTILPAFRSGLMQWKQIGERRADLGRMLDVMGEAVLLYDMSGNLVHANPAAASIMGGNPASATRLRGTETNPLQIEAQRVAWGMGSLSRRANAGSLIGTPGMMPAATTLPSATREARVNGQSYTLRGSLAPAWMLGRDPGVIVTVETTSATSTSDADLRERFNLTTREVEVARLVASGLSNQALAEKLGVSFFTARNHVERLMNKMSAMNRAHIGALVRGDVGRE